MRYVMFFLLLFVSHAVMAAEKLTSYDFDHVELNAVISYLADAFHHPIVLNKALHGVVTLHLKNVSPEEMYYTILKTYALKEQSLGAIFYVGTEKEFQDSQESAEKNRLAAEAKLPKTLKMWPIQYGKAEAFAVLLRDEHASLLSKDAYVKVDTRTNTLCVLDVMPHLKAVDVLIKQLDVPLKQIMISAYIVRLDESYERELGVRIGALSTSSEEKGTERGYGLLVAKLAKNSFIDVKLSALERRGVAELVSHPRIFTNNQETASIESGEEVPYQEVSNSGGTAVSFKKAVLGLKVTPKVLPNNDVLLTLEVSQDRPSSHLIQGVPTINTQTIKTSVLAKDGQTVVLGGIYEQDDVKSSDDLPFVSHIPLIGRFFTDHNEATNKRELLIFVTPKVITVAA